WLAEQAEFQFRGITGFMTSNWPVGQTDIDANAARKLLETMISLNPDMQEIEFDQSDIKTIGDILAGTASAINPQDINYYINAAKDEIRRSTQCGHIRILINRTTLSDGQSPLNWSVSPITAEDIHKKLDERYGDPGWDVRDPQMPHSQFSHMAPI
ncbi:MAG: hypothetical protein AAF988_05520, partial [Pseudomonadota bacterium]